MKGSNEMEPWRDAGDYNEGMEAQNGAVKGM